MDTMRTYASLAARTVSKVYYSIARTKVVVAMAIVAAGFATPAFLPGGTSGWCYKFYLGALNAVEVNGDWPDIDVGYFTNVAGNHIIQVGATWRIGGRTSRRTQFSVNLSTGAFAGQGGLNFSLYDCWWLRIDSIFRIGLWTTTNIPLVLRVSFGLAFSIKIIHGIEVKLSTPLYPLYDPLIDAPLLA